MISCFCQAGYSEIRCIVSRTLIFTHKTLSRCNDIHKNSSFCSLLALVFVLKFKLPEHRRVRIIYSIAQTVTITVQMAISSNFCSQQRQKLEDMAIWTVIVTVCAML